MTILKMQPTFTLDLPLGADDAIAKIKQAIESPELRDHAISAGQCAEFVIGERERRFWSPHLSIQLSDADSGSQLFGRFSPRPEVWTMFMMIYFMTAFVMCAGAIFGYVQWFMGHHAWGLLIIPAGAILIGLLHVASLIGQQLSSDQMTLLRQRLDRALEIAFKSDQPTIRSTADQS